MNKLTCGQCAHFDTGPGLYAAPRGCSNPDSPHKQPNRLSLLVANPRVASRQCSGCEGFKDRTTLGALIVAEVNRESATKFIPAPTWRPIAEMPKEWRDGRLVLCVIPEGDWGDIECDPVCLRYEGNDWYDDTGTERYPVLYLDLAIPEVPR